MSDTDKEWRLVRFTIDVVVDAETVPNEFRREALARQLTENMHSTILEDEDGANMRVEKYTLVHVHDATETPCKTCQYNAFDDRNGNSVVQEAAEMGLTS